MSASSIFSTVNLPELGKALLRVSPLILSSASMMYSWAQDVFFGAFMHPDLKKDQSHPSGNFLPRYMQALLKPALWGILLTYPPTMALSIANGLSNQSRDIRNLYWGAAVLSVGHFYWAPRMMAKLHRIQDPKSTGVAAEKEMESWFPHHHNRTLFVNTPAYLCLLAATLGTFVEGLQ